MNANSTGKSPWGGWLLHAAVGLGLTAVLAVLGTPRVALLVSVLAMGIAHEIGDGDFRRANGGPWNGCSTSWHFSGATGVPRRSFVRPRASGISLRLTGLRVRLPRARARVPTASRPLLADELQLPCLDGGLPLWEELRCLGSEPLCLPVDCLAPARTPPAA
jgi:hypothetical protein